MLLLICMGVLGTLAVVGAFITKPNDAAEIRLNADIESRRNRSVGS